MENQWRIFTLRKITTFSPSTSRDLVHSGHWFVPTSHLFGAYSYPGELPKTDLWKTEKWWLENLPILYRWFPFMYTYVYRIYIYVLYRWFSYIFPVNFGLIPSLQLLEDVAGNLSRRLRLGSVFRSDQFLSKWGTPRDEFWAMNYWCKYLLGIPLPNIGVPHI